MENRPDAPDLFYRELRHALRLLGDHPEIGQSVPLRRHPNANRYLLSGSLRHLYYDFTEDTLQILTVWGAVRDTRPSWSQFCPHRASSGPARFGTVQNLHSGLGPIVLHVLEWHDHQSGVRSRLLGPRHGDSRDRSEREIGSPSSRSGTSGTRMNMKYAIATR